MATKRPSDLPEETDPAADDVVILDKTTVRKATRANLLKENLESIRGLTSAADKGIQFTGAGTAATYDLTAAGKALLDDASAAAQRTTLGLVIGTDVQAYHAKLADLAGITYAQGDILYFNGTNLVKLAAGTSGNFLKTQGAGANPAWASIPGGGDLLSTNNLSDVANAATSRSNLGISDTLPTTQRFTSGSGTYTTPAGVRWIRVRCIGGGGGGQGSGTSAGNGGTGGSTTFGSTIAVGNGGTGGRPSAADAGVAGVTNTGGGGGGASTGSAGSCGGGAGGYAEIIIGSPSATYAYAVGAAGTAGAAGTSGAAGGAGGSGLIVVEEFYR